MGPGPSVALAFFASFLWLGESFMKPLPHHYRVKGSGRADGDVALTADRLPGMPSAPPPEFGGPDDRWSPETLLVAAVADCLILTFRAIARASKLSWTSLDCDVTGTLDRANGATQFTHFDVRARLVVPRTEDPQRARAVLDRAERSCLISSSLKGSSHLDAVVETVSPAQLPATSVN
jgi:organic hydroperoxide reductase OsmC/OhrA